MSVGERIVVFKTRLNMASLRSVYHRVLSWRPLNIFYSKNEVVAESSAAERKPSRRLKENMFLSWLSPFEAHVVSLQSFLIWEKPWLSAVALTAINLLFWLIVSWNRRFYSVLAIVCTLIFLYRTWVYQIWPEIRVPPPEGEDTEEWTPLNPQVLSVPELSRYLQDWVSSLWSWFNWSLNLRQTRHGMFCLMVCSLLTVVAVIGHFVPGVVIAYITLLVVTLGPGIMLYAVPRSWRDQFVAFICMFRSDSQPSLKQGRSIDSDSELEEFLPETNEENMAELSLTEDRSDNPSSSRKSVLEAAAAAETPDDNGSSNGGISSVVKALGMEKLVSEEEEISLCKGLESFPNVEEESGEELEGIELPSIIPSILGSNSEGNGNGGNGIHFVPTHFQNDSSSGSEGEDAFSEGLSFHGVVPGIPALQDAGPRHDLDTTPTHQRASPLLHTKSTSRPLGQSAMPRQSSQGSDVDIDEYDIVSESELNT